MPKDLSVHIVYIVRVLRYVGYIYTYTLYVICYAAIKSHTFSHCPIRLQQLITLLVSYIRQFIVTTVLLSVYR